MIVLPSVLPAPVVAALVANALASHHDDDGHHISARKTNWLPNVGDVLEGAIGFGRVDCWMALYRIPQGTGVSEHRDEDYAVGPRWTAKHSILVPLNDDYSGGQTMFANIEAPKVAVGGVLIFPHSLLHSARPVSAGTKMILKTDLLTERT